MDLGREEDKIRLIAEADENLYRDPLARLQRVEAGRRHSYILRRKQPLVKLVEHWCRDHGLDRASLRFHFASVALGEKDTADSLAMTDQGARHPPPSPHFLLVIVVVASEPRRQLCA